MAREYSCPHCWKSKWQPLQRKQWPKGDYTVRGWRKCDICAEVAEVPAGLVMCGATALLGLGGFFVIGKDIWRSIRMIGAGEELVRAFLTIFVYGSGTICVWIICLAGIETWRYTLWYRSELRAMKSGRT